MVKTNQILQYIIDIKEDTSAIKQHLKDLNGSVQKNIKDIIINKNIIDSHSKKLSYYAGALVVLIFILSLGIKYFI